MKIFKSKLRLLKQIFEDKNISFVPTMGALHNGHISLIKKSKKIKGKTIVSIFVNPKQFDRKNDFLNYKRNIKRDLKILKKLNVNYVYLPKYREIFSFIPKNRVFLDKFSKKLCGKFRKKHFEGVINVVNRFLEIIKPKYIYLGVKDFQQLCLIKKHILKRKIKTKVISCKTIREKNGVACSTRNERLNLDEKKIASNVYKYFINQKKKPIKKFAIIKKDLLDLGVTKVDYIEYYNLKTLKLSKRINKNCNIFIAYYLRKTRLIDNI